LTFARVAMMLQSNVNGFEYQGESVTWPTRNHESPDVDLKIPAVTAPHYLWSILRADGLPFRAQDYATVRSNVAEAVRLFGPGQTGGQRPSAEVSEQRLRTWKKAFEDMGILTVTDDRVRATRFGKAIIDGWSRVDDALQGANSRIALLGAEVANRILLAAPGRPEQGVPEDADLLPIRAIWRAFRGLDDKLHWQDINRVLGHIHYEREVQGAIEQVREFRRRHGGLYDAVHLDELGSPPISDDPRLITPWLNRASIGGLLFSSGADSEGFRTLNDSGRAIIDEMLAETPPPLPRNSDTDAYLRYLMEPVEHAEAPIADEDRPLVEDVTEATRKFGASKIIVLSGLPGTGKTRLARLAGERLVDGDESRLKEIQFHESVSYEDFVEGFVPRKDGSGFELRHKVLRTINERALANPRQLHVLIIEEFTRANAHAVMGELLTYVEHRNRSFQWSLSQDQSSIAANLVVIATMNPRDKSALQLDSAVKRRMHVISVGPSIDALSSILEPLSLSDRTRVIDWFGEHFSVLPFGHGIFAGAQDVAAISQTWRGTIVPLLSDATGAISPAYQQAYDEFPFR
jgi:hypothetical protein